MIRESMDSQGGGATTRENRLGDFRDRSIAPGSSIFINGCRAALEDTRDARARVARVLVENALFAFSKSLEASVSAERRDAGGPLVRILVNQER